MESQYDIIFAGGGAAACVAAGRLAAADPSLKILIIEDGPHTRDNPVHVQPARYHKNLMDPASKTIVRYQGRSSEALGGRSPVVVAGRCLGGGSCINFMMYTRAAASDYDDWETVHKNPGWGSKDLIPLLQKAETFHTSAPYHGNDGPIKVSYQESETNVGKDFLDVASRYDKKRAFADDTNGFFSCDVYGKWAQYIDPVTGRRSDTAHHYIYNQIDMNQNLLVLCEKRVVRVLFEGTRAIGVEYIDGPNGQNAIAKASRLVVLSAGAFGSPTILQRSGIGSRELLEEHNIELLVDLPGVGEHYMDHNYAPVSYVVSNDADTLDIIFRGDEELIQPIVNQWLETGKGLLTHNAVDAGIKIRPSLEDSHELGPEFESLWQEYFKPAPDKPIALLFPIAALLGTTPEAPTKKFVTLIYFTAYPVSFGFVRITSGTNAYVPVDFHPGILDTPVDVSILRWGYKRTREIARRMTMYRGEYAPRHPKFPNDSAAKCNFADVPVDINAPDITYSKEDDEAIDQYHRENASTTFHSTGTCAMKPREHGGVVDPRLNVYGTRCLKVADCSIAPGNVGSNTYNTALAIGEKTAVLIAEDLGIGGV